MGNKMESSRNRKIEIQYTSSVVIYGTIGVILRYINLPSELVAMCRGIIGTLFILTYLKIIGQKVDTAGIKDNLKWLVMSGISLGLNWIFLFAAYTHTTVAIASLCNYMAPTIAVLLSPILFKEKLNAKKIICVLAALVGIILVTGIDSFTGASSDSLGTIFGLLAAAAFVMIIVCNKHIRGISSFDKAIVQLGVSAVTILPYFLFANYGKSIPLDTRSVLLVLLLGVFHTGIAYIMYFSGVGVLPTNLVAVLGYLEPVVSVLCSAIILKEGLTPLGIVGAILIVGAAVVSEI